MRNSNLKKFINNLKPFYQQFLWSAKIRCHCQLDQKEAIQKLLEKQSVIIPGIPFMYFEVTVITECRALIFEGSESNLKLADEKLDELIQINSEQHNTIHLVELFALQAILLDKQKNFEASVTSFLKSIKLAEPGKVIACFVELDGPLMNIIGMAFSLDNSSSWRSNPLMSGIFTSRTRQEGPLVG